MILLCFVVAAFSQAEAGQIQFDFENANQLSEWEVIYGDWKIEGGVITGEFAQPAPGSDIGRITPSKPK